YTRDMCSNHMNNMLMNDVMQINTLASIGVDKGIRADKGIGVDNGIGADKGIGVDNGTEIDCTKSNVNLYKANQDTTNLVNHMDNKNPCE
ncbi:4805_t:CDS:2, partial [Gigaspora margarita]